MKFSELKIGDLFLHYAAGVHWTCVKIDQYDHHGFRYNAMTQHRLDTIQWKFPVDDDTEVTLLKEENE